MDSVWPSLQTPLSLSLRKAEFVNHPAAKHCHVESWFNPINGRRIVVTLDPTTVDLSIPITLVATNSANNCRFCGTCAKEALIGCCK